MEYNLTYNLKHAKHCNDGKRRDVNQYYLNNILILEQKNPYDSSYELGWQHRTDISDEYLLNGNLHQTREYKGKVRNVKYPISKNILEQFDIPKDLKITF